MSRQVEHLVRLIDDLLDVSRISRGKIELRRERLDFVSLVGQAVEAAHPLYAERHRQLHQQLPAQPLWVDGDATRLTQVVTNLLTNGVRYTGEGRNGEPGQVWLSVEASDGLVRLRVRDNGIGLAPDQLEAIFELFVQVDNSLARSQGGLGLGLTLVRRLVQMHGGRVEAHSGGLGQGSEFIVELPLMPPIKNEMNTTTDQAIGETTAYRVLVVDDNRDAATTLAMLLTIKKYDVHTRYSGAEALTAVADLQPTVVLLDIGMPGMDGYETARQIRQLPQGQHVVLIALTGYGQEEDKQRSQVAGFDSHLTKPVDLPALLQLLAAR
jgi:CheY-like chemotaxis protein/two-component sensor histidine kinase